MAIRYNYHVKYFTLYELTQSEKANQHKIDNRVSLTFDIIDNLYQLAHLLDDLRESLGHPINISSGYRCTNVNRIVQGSATSFHLRGCAADIFCAPSLMPKLWDLVQAYAMWTEYGWNKSKGYIHVAYDPFNPCVMRKIY